MRPKKDSFSIVLLGAWNPSIFSQEWIKEYIAEPDTENFTIAFPLDDPTAPRKISFEGVNVFPGRKQLLLQPEDPCVDGMKKCASVLVKILELLVHTPVTLCGINFSFEEDDDLEKLFSILSLSDRDDIPQSEYICEVTSIVRRFLLSDENVLNLTLSDERGSGQIGFNFHYEFGDIQRYRELFESDRVEQKFNEALEFCQSTYGLNLVEE